MRYLNIKTLKQTTKFIDDNTTVVDSDPRVTNWFRPQPDGFKGEWVDDIYSFIEIPPPSQADLEAQKMSVIENAIQSKLDNEARLAGYDSIHTAVTYAGETSVPKFATDGKSFRKWRSLVWEYCYAVLADYQAGNIPEPTIEDMIAGMPARV